MFRHITLTLLFICIGLFIFSATTCATVNVIIKNDDYIVFAADGRVTSDNFDIVSESYQKVIAINKNCMFTISGIVNPTGDNFLKAVKKFCKNNEIKNQFVSEILPLFRQYIHTEIKCDTLNAKIFIAGIDKQKKLRMWLYKPFQDSLFEYRGKLFIPNASETVFNRVLYGIDKVFKDSLANLINDYPQLPYLSKEFGRLQSKYSLQEVFTKECAPNWSLFDAVRYADFIVHSTIMYNEIFKYDITRKVDNDELLVPQVGGNIYLYAIPINENNWQSELRDKLQGQIVVPIVDE